MLKMGRLPQKKLTTRICPAKVISTKQKTVFADATKVTFRFGDILSCYNKFVNGWVFASVYFSHKFEHIFYGF